ncbi:MarR family winged helix-turn-helix transcriptional regulator [Propionigenium maris]|nr:MarR family transcriptional regulator [Propionigenium maris]
MKFRNGINRYIRMCEKEVDELNILDSVILTALRDNPNMLAKDFSKMLSIDPSYMTRDLVKLEKNELITREKDGRQKTLRLTEKGERICTGIERVKGKFLSELFKKVDPDELEASQRIFRAANKVLEEGKF